jgi:hypothetical protein
MTSSEKPESESVLATIGALDAPAVTAAKMLGGLIAACRNEDVHRTRAEVDLRAIQDIQRKLQADPEDASAKQWVRQLAQSWSFRVRDNTRSIRRIFDLLDGMPGPRR